jgi:hypothetical protein
VNRCPATVRGKWYPSLTAAARAHGVRLETVIRHLARYGHLDHLNRRLSPRRRPDISRPVTLFGRRFASVSEAAKVLGVDRKTIRNTERREAARMTVLRALMEKEAA